MVNNDVFENSDLLKSKIAEGYTVAVRGRAFYELKIDGDSDRAVAVKWKEYPNLPIPFTKKGFTYFIKPTETDRVFREAIFSATIAGYL